MFHDFYDKAGAKVICHKNAADYLRTGKKAHPFDFSQKAKDHGEFVHFMASTCMPEIPPCEPNIIMGDEAALENSVRRVLSEADLVLGGHGTPMSKEIIAHLV